MYAEIIGLYIFMGVLLLVGIVNLVLVLIMMKKSDNRPTYVSTPMMQSQGAPTAPTASATPAYSAVNTPTGNVVFCKKCACEFDAASRCCPRCGTPR